MFINSPQILTHPSFHMVLGNTKQPCKSDLHLRSRLFFFIIETYVSKNIWNGIHFCKRITTNTTKLKSKTNIEKGLERYKVLKMLRAVISV